MPWFPQRPGRVCGIRHRKSAAASCRYTRSCDTVAAMLRALVIAVVVGLLSGGATNEYQPPPVPYSGCISTTGPDGNSFSCSIVIPMVAAD